jgi:hypothetical protein
VIALAAINQPALPLRLPAVAVREEQRQRWAKRLERWAWQSGQAEQAVGELLAGPRRARPATRLAMFARCTGGGCRDLVPVDDPRALCPKCLVLLADYVTVAPAGWTTTDHRSGGGQIVTLAEATFSSGSTWFRWSCTCGQSGGAGQHATTERRDRRDSAADKHRTQHVKATPSIVRKQNNACGICERNRMCYEIRPGWWECRECKAAQR